MLALLIVAASLAQRPEVVAQTAEDAAQAGEVGGHVTRLKRPGRLTKDSL